jgi:dihydropyrimidine dehydrogenase (NAD+) subunit PreT
LGLQGVNALGAKDENGKGIEDAVDYIAELRQAKDLSKLPVGRRVRGDRRRHDGDRRRRAIEIAGCRGCDHSLPARPEQMKASPFEQELAQTKGVKIKHWVAPKKVLVAEWHRQWPCAANT